MCIEVSERGAPTACRNQAEIAEQASDATSNLFEYDSKARSQSVRRITSSGHCSHKRSGATFVSHARNSTRGQPVKLTNRYCTRASRIRRILAVSGCTLIVAALTHPIALQAQIPKSFQFEAVTSLDDMQHLIETDFPLGSPRETLRRAFVEQGKATLKMHPVLSGVEKYIFDINLCSYYVWRWNISADFDTGGRLVQAYVNGEPVFPTGPQKKDVKDFHGGHQSIYKIKRSRPEASKGEKDLAYMLFDADSDTSTIDDQLAIGGGATRADPANMGTLHMYGNVDPWRSIFDRDDAARIVSYAGDCKEADLLYSGQGAGAH